MKLEGVREEKKKKKKKLHNLLLCHVDIQSCAFGIKNMLIYRVICADF